LFEETTFKNARKNKKLVNVTLLQHCETNFIFRDLNKNNIVYPSCVQQSTHEQFLKRFDFSDNLGRMFLYTLDMLKIHTFKLLNRSYDR